MQLILTQPTTEDIQIKMSTQTESPVNGNISEIKEINQTFQINDDTITALEKSSDNESSSESSKDIVIGEEKNLDYNTNTNSSNCIPAADLTTEGDPVENLNSFLSENLTNGTECTRDANDTEYKTQNSEMPNFEELALNKAIDLEVYEPNSSNNNLERVTELEKESCLANKDKPLCKNNETSLEDKNDTLMSVDVPVSSLEKDKISADDFTMNAEINKPSKALTDACQSDTEKLNDEAKHMEMTMSSSEYPDDIVMDEKVNKLSEEPINVVTKNEPNLLLDEGTLAFLDSEDVAMSEVSQIDNGEISDSVNITICEDNKIDSDEFAILLEKEDPKPNNMNEVVLSGVQTSENIISPEVEDINLIHMDEEVLSLVQTGENAISPAIQDIEPIQIDEEVLSSVQTGENVICPEVEDIKPIHTDEEVLPLVQTGENVISLDVEDIEPIQIDEEVLPLAQTGENVISPEVEDIESIQIDKDVLLPIQTCNNVISSEADDIKHFEIAKNKLPNKDQSVAKNKNREETCDTTMTQSKTTSACVAVDITEQLQGVASDNLNFTKINKETNVLDDEKNVNYTKISKKNKVLDSENVSVEIDAINKLGLENENIRISSDNKCDTNANSSKDTIDIDTTRPDAILEITAKQILFDNTSGDLKNNKLKDISESEVSMENKIENKTAGNILTAKNLENGDTSVAVDENKNTGDDLIEQEIKGLAKEDQENVEIIDEDDVIVDLDEDTSKVEEKEENSPEPQETKTLPVVCKLSNTLDILSDEEEEASDVATNKSETTSQEEKQCINIDDDDDIMLIEEEDLNSKDKTQQFDKEKGTELKSSSKCEVEAGEKHNTNITDSMSKNTEKDTSELSISNMELDSAPKVENNSEGDDKTEKSKKPLLPQNFLKTAKKSLAGMTRHELEDFCILRIVESIVDRTNLSDIKNKIKTMAQNIEEYKKRAMMMTKQNRDLQVVLKSVQEEQKKRTNAPIQPLKITRSVGMQVLMNDKIDPRRSRPIPNPIQATPAATAGPTGRPVRAVQNVKQSKPGTPPNIPVPRKVPVNNSPAKALTNTSANNVANKSASPNPNGLRNPSPIQKAPEKRTHSRMQSTSVTVDLTDDEPPAKISNKSSPAQPVRVVPPQNLLAQQRQFPPLNNARKVYIPISGPQAQQIRAGQTIVMKNIGPRPGTRLPIRPQQNQIRPKQLPPSRHPAPLPESMKQYTPPTWKALPPAPDLKLSKVENGIVISWKIDGYPEGGYETIASYQLYAYQETTAPPCTALWKKIGDVKALPLPMACTLTQFMAGFKYYFAVRAVDVRSRLGPFSLPGSILLLNKM